MGAPTLLVTSPGAGAGLPRPQQPGGLKTSPLLSLSCDNPGRGGELLCLHNVGGGVPASPPSPMAWSSGTGWDIGPPGPAVQRDPCPCHRSTPSRKGVGNKSLARGPWVHGSTALFQKKKGESERDGGIPDCSNLPQPKSLPARGGTPTPPKF